ncbi:MAG: DNA-3-methyladenine glycosylase [Melioribacteraceae bacterium]|nr:DNA-3-methyladenine glycosylase [Melioribacteraceae bacterium]
MKISIHKKVPLKFYKRDVLLIAKELLGKYLVRKTGKTFIAGKIVEVEAYDGTIDEASHTYRGKTKRNQVMFEGGGKLYVYFTYGMHFCANVVTGKMNDGKAILIRAVEPTEGIQQMIINRYGKEIISEKELINLCNGPGKVCRAFNINVNDNGTKLTGNDIFIVDSKNLKPVSISTSKRIGIKKSVDLPWRYYITGNKFVSRLPSSQREK